MNPGIDTAQVRSSFLVPMLFAFQKQHALALLRGVTESAATPIQPELKWHVEARQILHVQLYAAQVMNSVSTVTDELQDIVQTLSASVIELLGTARPKPASYNSEYNRVEDRIEV